MAIGLFDVATSGEDESRIRKQAADDKIAAAVYDVRQKFGSWLFAASDSDAFEDRARLSYVDICKTIEPHVHARKGVHSRVLKALKNEWRQRQAAPQPEVPGAPPVPSPQAPPPQVAPMPSLASPEVSDPSGRLMPNASRRQACWPGCHENEAHAKKYHKDKKDDREARRQAGLDDPSHRGPEHAKAMQDYLRWLESDDPQARFENKPNVPHGFPDTGREAGRHDDPNAPDGYGHGDEYDDYSHVATPPSLVNDGGRSRVERNWGPADRGAQGRHRARHAAEDGAFERNAPDHPEQHIDKTYREHQGEELIPEGNWDGYRDRVDQGGPEKVDNHAFDTPATDTGAATPQRHDEDGDDNFVNAHEGRIGFYYNHVARLMQAADPAAAAPGAPALPQQGAPGSGTEEGLNPAAAAPIPGMGGGAGATDGTAGTQQPIQPMASREYIARLMQASPGLAPQTIGGGDPLTDIGPSVPTTNVDLPNMGSYQGVDKATQGVPGRTGSRQLLADKDYLRQADEALTKVLNEQAEQFQQTIAPLQQALITVQQAQQLQNPLNVSPPAGTVNVMPGQPQGAGMPGQDPTGMTASPAAAALAGQQPAQSQMTARRKQARPKMTPLGTRPTKPDTNVYRSNDGNPWEQVPDEENWNPQHKGPRPDRTQQNKKLLNGEYGKHGSRPKA